VLDQGFGPFALRRVLSVVEERNGASHRIMEALGFRLDHDRVTPKGRIFIYALSAEDWAGRRAAQSE
jgi:RimJ/RimL family protein N-acetyltransferase